MSVNFGDSDSALEEVERRAEPGLDVTRKEAGAAVDDVAEGVGRNAGLA